MYELPIVRPLALADLSAVIVDSAIRVHRDLGPGMLEAMYQMVLEHLLRKRGLTVEREVSLDFHYDGVLFERALRIDLLVEGAIVLELKSTDKTLVSHSKQLLTYLKLTGLQVGLLLNFGAPRLIDGLQRIVNNAPGRPGSP